MKINQVKVGVILSYLQMGLHIVIGLIYTPIMLRLLGQSEYGLYNTVSSTISTMSILSLGLGGSYIRYFSIYRKDNNYDEMARLNGSFLLIYSIIGGVIVLCGGYLTAHLELVFDTGLSLAEYGKAKILMVLLTFNLAAGFPMSVFASIISAHEKFIFQKVIGSIQTVLSPCLTIPLLLLGYGSVGLVSVSVGLSVVSWLIQIYYCFKKLNTRISFRGLQLKFFKSLFAFSIFIALNMIVDQINWNIDKILLGRYQGTVAVAIYSVGFSLYSYYQLFSTSVSNVFTPRIHKIVNETKDNLSIQRTQLTNLFVKVGRIQFEILGLIASGVVFLGKDFILNIWAGKEYEDAYYVALLLIIPASIALIQNIGIEIQRAQNQHQFRSVIYIGMAVINLVLSILLCQKYGAIGCAIGTAVSLIIANGLIMNIFYHKKCNIDIVTFWREIGSVAKGMIIPFIFGTLLSQLDYGNIYIFIGKIFLYTIVYIISLYCIGMNCTEKGYFVKLLQAIKHKRGDS